MLRLTIGLCLLCLWPLAEGVAQPGRSEVDVRKPPPIKELDGGRLDVGGVIVDRVKKTATFPASGCIADGPVEYLLVHETGKTHESVFQTRIEPFDLHTAMLLLGAKPRERKGAVDSPTMITKEFLAGSPKPEGPTVILTLSRGEGADSRESAASATVLHTETQTALPATGWVYTGSGLYRGEFLAQSSGSIISIITDPEALVNYVGEGRTRDDVWKADPKTAPSAGTTVTLTIKIAETTTQ